MQTHSVQDNLINDTPGTYARGKEYQKKYTKFNNKDLNYFKVHQGLFFISFKAQLIQLLPISGFIQLTLTLLANRSLRF